MRATYIRMHCGECHRLTTWRRFGSEEESSAKVECAEHHHPMRQVDWVQVAIEASATADRAVG